MTAGVGKDATAGPASATRCAAAYAFVLLAATIGAWLAWSLRVVNIELDDGYATIVNSQYFLGISADYLWSRAPMMAWLLMPAEWLATALDLHPLDVRPHHALMAALHFAYLVGVWRLLRARFGTTWPVLIAFTAAIPTVVFFSYAPFISHDLLPGLAALAMLVLADRYASERSWRLWWALVALGAAVALVKHTYGAIWLAILIAHACLLARERPRDWRLLIRLAAAAACSGLIFWLVMGLVLGGGFAETPLWMRPLRQMRGVMAYFQQAGPLSEGYYQWVYVRNLSAYGILAMALAVPGLYLSWRNGDRLQRSAVIVWIVLLAVMQLIGFKEVRYLAYLAPLTALLLVPVVTQLLRWRRLYAAPMALLLLVDLGSGAREAMRIDAPFYRDQVQRFLGRLPQRGELAAPLVVTRYLSFVAPDRHAFFGDRYHRIVHLNDEQIRLLYGYPRQRVWRVADVRAVSAEMLVPGSILIFVNGTAARVPPIASDNRTTLQPDFVQLLATAEALTLRRDGDDYRLDSVSAQPIMLLRADHVDAEPLTSFERFPMARTGALLGLDATPDQLPVLGLRIHAFCDIGGCREY